MKPQREAPFRPASMEMFYMRCTRSRPAHQKLPYLHLLSREWVHSWLPSLLEPVLSYSQGPTSTPIPGPQTLRVHCHLLQSPRADNVLRSSLHSVLLDLGLEGVLMLSRSPVWISRLSRERVPTAYRVLPTAGPALASTQPSPPANTTGGCGSKRPPAPSF